MPETAVVPAVAAGSVARMVTCLRGDAGHLTSVGNVTSASPSDSRVDVLRLLQGRDVEVRDDARAGHGGEEAKAGIAGAVKATTKASGPRPEDGLAVVPGH